MGRTHGIRQGIDLCAYEVHSTPEQCLNIYPRELREIAYDMGEPVDVFDPDFKEWKIGKIQHKVSSGTDDVYVVIDSHSSLTPVSKEIRVNPQKSNIAPFMTHTMDYRDVEILPLYHRYQKPDGTSVYFGFPKLVAVGAWATCYQVASEVVLQTKHFMEQETRTGNVTKIRPIMSIAGGSMRYKRPTEIPSRAMTVNLSKHSSLFSITLIDTRTNTCAICSSKQIAAKRFLQSIKPKRCKGCNILDNKEMPIKYASVLGIVIRFLVNYFGNVALCVDWKSQSDYMEPKIRVDDSATQQQQAVYKPSLDDCLKLYTDKVGDGIYPARRRKSITNARSAEKKAPPTSSSLSRVCPTSLL
ncbi:MAG: hypothetical protein P4M11_06785 [Candidatus Pacebacteria bacterium]|nr:hypothetical protein [Candidatus Paceibacterota bacterium]